MHLIKDTPSNPKTSITWLFAHGAGAPMDSDFMNEVAAGVCQQGIPVVRFEFPYMAERRETGKKRPPNRAPALLAHFQEVIAEVNAPNIVIGGKSMGGRMATLLADEIPGITKGVICLGYPFHAAGKPEKLRIDHLQTMETPTLIVQGTRDALGNQSEVLTYPLDQRIQIHWLDDGDHNLKPRKASGHTHAEHLATTIEQVSQFIFSLENS